MRLAPLSQGAGGCRSATEVQRCSRSAEACQATKTRLLMEDSHHCLKSGCRIEHRHLQTVDGLMRLLGLVSPLAVRLLQVRALAREDPQRPAHEVIEPLM